MKKQKKRRIAAAKMDDTTALLHKAISDLNRDEGKSQNMSNGVVIQCLWFLLRTIQVWQS